MGLVLDEPRGGGHLTNRTWPSVTDPRGQAPWCGDVLTRMAKLLPGTLVRVEVIDDLPIAVGWYPSVGNLLP